MATQEQVVVELCQSNSIGSHYHDPRVVELRTVTREEADRLLSQTDMPNGFFYREQVDYTGAGE